MQYSVSLFSEEQEPHPQPPPVQARSHCVHTNIRPVNDPAPASELIPSLIAQVLSRGLKEKRNPVYFSRLLLLAMNFSSWRNMESASEFSTSVYTVGKRGGEIKQRFGRFSRFVSIQPDLV